jgi:hypothetical protein
MVEEPTFRGICIYRIKQDKKKVKSNQFTYNPQVQTEDVNLNSVNPDPEKCLGQM